MKLTNTKCKNAKATEKSYKLFDGHGLYLEVMPNGSKYWRLKYRYLGKEKRLAFGVYPEVSLSEARKQRENARELLANATDPSEVRKAEKRNLLLNSENTFEAVAHEWYSQNLAKWSEKHAQTILLRLKNDIFPHVGSRPINDITAAELLSTIKLIEKRGAHEMARRARQYCGQVFRYAIITGRAQINPAQHLQGALKPVKRGHYAALEAKDLPEFLETLHRNEARLFALTRFGVEMLLLTFVRTSELIKAKWSEFDLPRKTWTIPAERMKMGNSHIVPLSQQTIEILKEIKKLSSHRDWVFPSQKNPRKHMSNNTILLALKRMGYKGKTTGHGFRALAMSTIKEHLGYRHEVVDRQLAHAHRNEVDAAYDRAKFLPERKKMMQEWADYLDELKNIKKLPRTA
jgi:integrase